MKKTPERDKLILAGLYLSKFDSHGLERLGFGGFVEAFNVLGLAIGGRPASIKGYRDEFDPLFPNSRMGWHKRPMRAHCKAILDQFGGLDEDKFTALIKSVIYKRPDLDVLAETISSEIEAQGDTFAKRLITGQAAEQYFRSNYDGIAQFKGFDLEDTTQLGCGFDFKLASEQTFLGIEVKGLNEPSGSVMLTEKEHKVAAHLRERYFLFVVKNFKEKPFHDVYQNPLNSALAFSRLERSTVQVSWRAAV